ncbi:MAG: DUF192 domain-containing protein [Lentisphaerae bacterium]|nr:DUF192 domain-containing protein [Lentisphaerota bacterium]
MTEFEFLRGGEVLLARVEKAVSLPQRMKGLLGRTGLDDGRGMWIVRCGSIHTWFMLFPIDVVFLDRSLRVVSVHSCVGPFRAAAGGHGAVSVLEAPGGWAERNRVSVGDVLQARLRGRP